MQRVNPCCAGIDVHRDSLRVCIRSQGQQTLLSFGTTSREVLALGEALAQWKVTIVALEATGVYWRPVWNLLEDRFQLMLVNAQHVKHVPGRKTDSSDAQWLAELLECGLLRPSFVPPRPQRELRELTRQRSQLLSDRARVINRIHKVLESADLKLSSVFSDLGGASGRRVLHALAQGRASIEQMVELVDKRMQAKKPALREALAGQVSDHVRFMLSQLLEMVEHLDGQIEDFDQRIQEVMSPLEHELAKKLDEVPGLDERTAQNLLAEIGTDMSRFPSSAHLCSWAGLCPGNHESAGKRKRGTIRKANRWLKAALTQAAWGASRTRGSYFGEQHRRLSARRGLKRATIAVAHSLLVVCYHLIRDRERAYQDLGVAWLVKQPSPEHEAQRLVRRLQRLGYQVNLHCPAA
jgi:transposase